MQPNYLDIICNNSLFKDIEKDEILNFLKHSGSFESRFEKGHVLILEQSIVGNMGIILSGGVEASKLDLSGKKLVISKLGPGSLFGDVISLRPGQKSPVSVAALEAVTALMIPSTALLSKCEKNCDCHNIIIKNLLGIVASKYFELHDRINCIMRPTLREKILYYLNTVSENEKSQTFNIPFSRAALAEYLNAERSALSRELSNMKSDGVIDYYKNTFKLL